MLVICAGMIRAGSTLQYNLARTLVANLNLGTGEGFHDVDDKSVLDRKLTHWAEDTSIHVVKMHAIPPVAVELAAGGSARFCYVYRDIRDVAASAKRFWGVRGEKLHEALDSAIDTYDQVTALPNVLSWKYEELTADLAPRVLELAEFLALDAPPAIVSSVVAECSLERAKADANGGSQALPSCLVRLLRRLRPTRAMIYHRDTLLHRDHISKTEGKSGIWRNQLAREESDAIARRHGRWLEARGYQL